MMNDAERLKTILQGAFSGAPTLQKDIPKKTGNSRAPKGGSASGATMFNRVKWPVGIFLVA